MTLRVLRAADRVATPWKNGGGVTREVAASPSGAGLDAFDWRVSLAEVARSGPFSRFPGVDRVLTVIRGSGLRLDTEDMTPVILDDTSPPHLFPGEAACRAELASGPIHDLNVMVRRATARARVARFELTTPTVVGATADQTLVVALGAVICGNQRLDREDAVLLERGQSVRLEGFGQALLIEIDQLAGA